jgi:hypothetical protein
MTRSALLVTVMLSLTACSSSSHKAAAPASTDSCALPTFGPGDQYNPTYDAATFTATVDNKWFPLPVGRTWLYTGTKDGKPALDVVTVSSRTRVIDGVTTHIVEDRLFLDNALEEKTADYYAQDKCGNVWYFGEDTGELNRAGKVTNTSGSFHAGEKGAEAGVFMEANPRLNERFRQEWYKGEAEDTYRAIDLATNASVPYGNYDDALRTEETTRLEPDVVDNKLYAPGIGEVVEVSLKGAREELRLIDVLN